MIISLKDLLTENIKNTAFVSFIKEQMIDLYGELTEISDIKNNIFLQIIQYNPIFIEMITFCNPWYHFFGAGAKNVSWW